jgi:DNA transformation protein
MVSDSEFPEHIIDLLSQVDPPFAGSARLRRMFGGYGIFCDGVMFALIADDVLYLKVDAETQPDFDKAGAEPFVYEKAGKPVERSYMTVPGAGEEDIETFSAWAHMALAAAHRAKTKKPAGKR